MKCLHAFHAILIAALAALLPITARAVTGHMIAGSVAAEPLHVFMGDGFGFRHDRFFGRDHRFFDNDRDDRFFFRHRFFDNDRDDRFFFRHRFFDNDRDDRFFFRRHRHHFFVD